MVGRNAVSPLRAEAAGDPGPWRQQAILGRGRWEADALRDAVRDYALESLAEPDAVLVLDEIGFLKKGKASCGVGRQYTGSAGKITNCQIGVFAAYVSGKSHAFIDRALYLPKDWTRDPARMRAAHMPEGVKFATKPRLAADMIERAIGAGVPFAWVAADTVYGVGEVEMALRRAGKGYVLGANATDLFNPWLGKPPASGTAEEIAHGLDASAWRWLSAGEGTKGPRSYDRAYLELADHGQSSALPDIADGGCAYFSTWCPVRDHDQGSGHGRRAALGDRGRLRDGQDRTGAGPQRNPFLARLASPRVLGHARLRHAGRHPPPRESSAAPKKGAAAASPATGAPTLVRWSVQEVRRVANRLARRRIRRAHVIAWSLWRRAHQAAQRSHLKRKTQL